MTDTYTPDQPDDQPLPPDSTVALMQDVEREEDEDVNEGEGRDRH